MSSAPLLFVSSGTLVLETVPDNRALQLLVKPLELPHRLGLIPDPKRLVADAAYSPLKREFKGECWVQPLAGGGLKSRMESVELARLKLRKMREKFPDRKIIGVGQSQGGLIIRELAIDPEFRDCFAGVVLAGTPNLGSDVPNTRRMSWSRRFPGVAEMTRGHPSLVDLDRRTEAGWSPRVPVMAMAGIRDVLVDLESALSVALPKKVSRRLCIFDSVVPVDVEEAVEVFEVTPGYALPEGLDDVEVFTVKPGHDHLGMCRRTQFVQLVREFREELTPRRPTRPKPRTRTRSAQTARAA